MPDSASRREFRLRITGTNNPHQDIEDLKAWLEREPWLAGQGHEWVVRPQSDDEGQRPEGAERAEGLEGAEKSGRPVRTGQPGRPVRTGQPGRPVRTGQPGRPDTGRRDMAIGADELILVVTGAFTAEITKSLLITLREWLRQRREERAAGEEPGVALGDGGGLRDIGDAPPGDRPPGNRPCGSRPPGRPDPRAGTDEGGGAGEG
ncbi:hypothetical protein [Streptomyces sp. MST-110588]|uniref:hypothetical protein n=1 Tax=Streptomyces sp. MST-110588 TaxID=2833628 RepID=UPI001F5C719C|nr:hypothetical protein [Streptomyces sp. MST-110588]UNO42773.1 hypothetical protein KGS77_28625 [Streptomyces sp. MST-110588]